MIGPKLTQRKIDKLRDAINVVAETDQVQTCQLVHITEPGEILIRFPFARLRKVCDDLQQLLNERGTK